MKCSDYQDLILQYDMLNEEEQQKVEQHIKTCDECHRYYEMFQQMNEALDIIAIEEDIERSNQNSIEEIYKKRKSFGWKNFLLAASVLLLVSIGFSFTPTGQAAIQKALNIFLAEKAEKSNDPLPEVNGKQKALYAVVQHEDGTIVKVHTTGDKTRIEHENGSYDIMVGKKFVSYHKEENIFIIDELMYEYGEYEAKLFESMDESKIEYLGTDTYLNRPVEKYKVEIGEGRFDEYWFDQEYGQVLRVFTIHKDERTEGSKLLELKEIELEKNSKLFDLTPPEGAEVIHQQSQNQSETAG